jgi:hypothetical protein
LLSVCFVWNLVLGIWDFAAHGRLSVAATPGGRVPAAATFPAMPACRRYLIVTSVKVVGRRTEKLEEFLSLRKALSS